MALLNRTTAGLIFREPFDDLSNWRDIDPAFSVLPDPTLIAFPHPTPALAPPHEADDLNGVREGLLFILDDEHWYILYDAGNGSSDDETNGWRQFLAESTNRGISWNRLGALNMGLDDGDGGEYAAVATGHVEKRGSTYYLHRVTAPSTWSPPDYGLPNAPYEWDIWSTTDHPSTWTTTATWTFVRRVPLGTGGSWDDTQRLPGNTFQEGGTYYQFPEGSGGGGYEVGLASSATPDGVQADLGSIQGAFSDSRTPENARVFFHDMLNRHMMLLNLIHPGGTHTDQNAILVNHTGDVSDWSSKTDHRIQRVSAMDGLRAIGVITHVMKPDGVIAISGDGYLSVLYDCDPVETTPGWHSKRSLRTATLEPSAHIVRFVDESGDEDALRMTSDLVNDDGIWEFSYGFNTDSNEYLSIFLRLTGDDGYRFTFSNDNKVIFQRIVDGAVDDTVIGTGEEGIGHFQHRGRIELIGSSIKVYVDGELQIDHTDATYASGTEIAVEGTVLASGTSVDLRHMHARASNTVTITGLSTGQLVVLRDGGGMPVVWGVAGGDTVELTHTHSPLHTLSVDGVDYTVAQGGLIWGGDELDLFVPERLRGGILTQSGDSLFQQGGDEILLQADLVIGGDALLQNDSSILLQDGTDHLLIQGEPPSGAGGGGGGSSKTARNMRRRFCP